MGIGKTALIVVLVEVDRNATVSDYGAQIRRRM
jgi:hypothetical protein